MTCRHKKQDCNAVPGEKPCYYCMKTRNRDSATNSCTLWIAPKTKERMDLSFFKLEEDEEGVEIVVRNDKIGRPRQRDKEGWGTKTKKTKDDWISSASSSSNSDNDETVSPKTKPILLTAALSALLPYIDLATAPVPQSYRAATSGPESVHWQQAIQDEYKSLIDNNTWEVATLPKGRKALTTKWVLKRKLGPDGKISRYKARMVARGFQQQEGFDFTETYSGVVKSASYRLIFAMIALHS
jgi:hypothetical protein